MINKAVAAKAMRHIAHHGGEREEWYVGIEEPGSDRDDSDNRILARYDMRDENEAKATMSHLLEQGLSPDDEYDAEPTVLFIYTHRKREPGK